MQRWIKEAEDKRRASGSVAEGSEEGEDSEEGTPDEQMGGGSEGEPMVIEQPFVKQQAATPEPQLQEEKVLTHDEAAQQQQGSPDELLQEQPVPPGPPKRGKTRSVV